MRQVLHSAQKVLDAAIEEWGGYIGSSCELLNTKSLTIVAQAELAPSMHTAGGGGIMALEVKELAGQGFQGGGRIEQGCCTAAAENVWGGQQSAPATGQGTPQGPGALMTVCLSLRLYRPHLLSHRPRSVYMLCLSTATECPKSSSRVPEACSCL